MKKTIHHFAGLLLICFFSLTAKSQYVTIPDTVFVNWLDSSGYAGCMVGNQLDTTCSAVLNATSLYCYALPIRDLTGVQYFKNLDTLDCSNDSIGYLPSLPSTLVFFNCSNSNNLFTTPPLPDGLLSFNCSLSYRFSTLPVLPAGLKTLICGNSDITALPQLPAGLDTLNCRGAQLYTLPPLPTTLRYLDCGQLHLTSLPTLPAGLTYLDCSNNYGALDTLPALPAGLVALTCYSDSLNSLPVLPPALNSLNCGTNNFTSLPALPANLFGLFCEVNHLTTLPALPLSINSIDCDNNNLTSLPALPDNLYLLYCYNNPDLTCLPDLNQLVELDIINTGITCLPNYGRVSVSYPSLSTIPLCGIFNTNGCQPFWDVSGQAYIDNNGNCIDDSLDGGIPGVKTQVYNGGTLVQQVYTVAEGFYSFDSLPYGTYTVQIDTTNLPFATSCPDSNFHTVTLSATDTFSNNNNFAFRCQPQGFDIGAQSVINIGIPRPNAPFALNTIAGDISELYGAHCAAGISGQVQITFSGPVSYTGAANGALTPDNIIGNTLAWNIADYGAVNDLTAFNLLFKIDSLATPGSLVCFTITVTPTNGDYNPSNNTLGYCFTVVDAIDPNEKEASPPGNTDTANHWLTYTIRFQNTGTAPAQNIRITDTLDNNLDASTFQLLSYSAKNLTQVMGNNVVFNFPNINLPDSFTSSTASRGYIQYKIKLKDNLPLGTQIQNTADIYFDLNPTVVTNTTVNTLALPAGISQVNEQLTMQLYPNPTKNYVIVETDVNALGGTLQITDVTGRAVYTSIINNSNFRINTSVLTGGIYLVKISDLNGRVGVGKLVVE